MYNMYNMDNMCNMYNMYWTVCKVCTARTVCTVCRVCTIWTVCTVCTYVRRYSEPNIFNLLKNIGHRFAHQSGLDRSSGRIPTTFDMELRFASVWCIRKQTQSSNNNKRRFFLGKLTFIKQCMSFNNKKRLRRACSAVSEACGYQSNDFLYNWILIIIPYWYYMRYYISTMLPLLSTWAPCYTSPSCNVWLMPTGSNDAVGNASDAYATNATAVCISMHPHASKRLIYSPNGNIQHTF